MGLEEAGRKCLARHSPASIGQPGSMFPIFLSNTHYIMKTPFKHKILTYTAAAFTALSMVSCADSFLDREPGGDYVTDGQIAENMKWNTNLMLGQMQGVSSKMVAWRSGGTTRQDDFGQKSVDIVTDLKSGDLVFSRGCKYGWLGDAARLQDYTSSADRAYIVWRYYYAVINAANAIIDGSNGQQPETAEQALYYAVAKTVRSHSYFNLLVNYALPYDESKNNKVLPLYTTATEDAYLAPSTVDQVYSFIIQDLKEAIAAYQFAAESGVAPSDISMPDVSVAYAVLAYAYLQKGDNAEALAAAQSSIQNSDKQILPANNVTWGFNSVDNDNWMWGLDITSESTGGLCTFWGMMDYFTYSYTAAGDYKSANVDVINQMGENDVRRNQFPSNYLYMPVNKFYDAARQPMGDAAWTNDIHFMRIEEPYLIAAEAAARQGNTTVAATYLKALLDNRDADKAEAVASMSAEQMLNDIYFEWRAEFVAEGRSLMTLKRFKASETRPSNDYYASITRDGAINYNDKRLYFGIPNKEKENNPLMKDATSVQ